MLDIYRKIFAILTPPERTRFLLMLGLVFLLSIFEAASVVSILPFLQIVANPEVIETNRIFSRLYEWGGFQSTQSFTIFVGILAFFITVFGLIFKALMVWLMTRFALMRSYGISARLLSGYLHQPYVWFLSRHSSDLGSGVLTEVDKMVSSSLLPALRMIPETVLAVLLVCILFVFEPYVAIGFTVLLGGAYATIYMLVRKLLMQIGTERVEANKDRFHVVQEATGGIKELKLIGLEETFLIRFRHAAYKMARAQTMGQVMSQMPRFALEALAFGGMILMVLALAARDDGDLGALLPTLGLIAVTGMRLFPALQQIYARGATIRFSQNTLDRLHDDIVSLDAGRAKDARIDGAKPPLHLRKDISLKNVSYSYPKSNVSSLNDMNVTIPANTTVGIVGGTGAGKTTLVDIILGLLQPTQGALYIDGHELTLDQVRPWQKSIGYVPQQIFLSDDSVARNIAFGIDADEIDMAQVENVARIASLHDFILQELPNGYKSKVGERGVRLSGGQRQRIGIARALYHDPDVLIMDEATSALDNLTERDVMKAVATIAGQKTIIMIAHRLTTVKNCDKIFLLRDGQVAASGHFDQLIEADEQFRQMASSS